MKLNWNTFKVVVAFVVIVGVIFWAVNSVRPRSYSGTNLSFDVTSGLNSINNPSDETIAAQFVGSGSRTFRVASNIEEVSGSSTRIGSGSDRSHLFEFNLPPGTSDFTISGGTDVRFTADTDTQLEATVNPMSNAARRNALIATAVVVLVALFYASNATGHQWLRSADKDPSDQDTENLSKVTNSGQGRAARSYGDNRAER